ncbi:MAG TPA: hypothetical protein VF891_00340 [Gaiellaceae bacterium]
MRAGEMVWGLVQETQLPLSTRHWKLELGSLELKLKLGVAFPDGLEGLASIVVSGAVRSTVQVWLAGVWSALPAWSVARTSKVWLPSVRAGEMVWGLVQEAQLPLSMRHSKPAPGSLEKLKLGIAFPDGLEGLASMVVLGAVRSTVQVWLAGEPSVLPAWSVARTSKVWLPSVRAGEMVWGLVQEAQLPLSTRHSKLELGSLELKLKLGVAFPEGLDGLASIVVSGAVRSTAQV